MLRIHCPFCGLRDHLEFEYRGDAGVERPALDNESAEAWHDYVFIRENPRGRHAEFWHHIGGCRQFVIVERDTRTHEIFSTRLASGKGAGR